MKKIPCLFLSIIGMTLLAFNSYGQAPDGDEGDTLIINWPIAEVWHVANQQRSVQQTMVELLKSNETFENFTEIGTEYIFRLRMNVAIKDKIDELYQRVKKNAPSAKKTMIEKDESAKSPWYIYKIESPTESQVWYAIQGKDALFVNFFALRQSKIPADVQEKWVKIFKASKITKR